MGLSLDKIANEAPELLSLAKSANIALEKRRLNAHTAKVALVVDYSGSMNSIYKSGAIQELAEKVLALGAQFDDDGAIDFFVFDTSAAYLGEVALNDYRGSVNRLTQGRHMGTTNYAAAFEAVVNHYNLPRSGGASAPVRGGGGLSRLFSKKPAAQAQENNPISPVDEPVYVVFLTDGAPNSQSAAVKTLTEASHYPIFWQFLSIGGEIPFLQKLDDLEDRYIDNADYKAIRSLNSLTDDQLWANLLDEYPSWIAEQKRRGILR